MNNFVQVCEHCKTDRASRPYRNGRHMALCEACYEWITGASKERQLERKNEAARKKYATDPDYRDYMIQKAMDYNQRRIGA